MRYFLAKLLIVVVISVFFLISWGNLKTHPAFASIRQIEEAPQQILIQSRHTLKDNMGNAWQVVLFKRSFADHTSEVNLRLVGFPGRVTFIHPHSLSITTHQGKNFEVEDLLAEESPAENMGQYDLQSVLPQLPVTALQLALPTQENPVLALSVPPEIVLEWQDIGNQSTSEIGEKGGNL